MLAQRILRRRTLWRNVLCSWQLYLFLLLPLLYIVIFHYMPMVGVQIAFRKYTPRGGIWGSPWVGIAQFQKFFRSYQFERVLRNTLTLSVYGLFAGFPLPILFALCLNVLPGNRYKRLVQMTTYAPHFISVTVLVGMLMSAFNARTGLYGVLYQRIHQTYPQDLFSVIGLFKHLYVWSGIWQNLGWNAIIYMAALSSVDPELHEAAQIDGASRFQRVRHVDLPCILPTAAILLILSAGNIMSVGFEKVYLMQNSVNLRASETISTYVYKVGLQSGGDFSLSTAIGLFNSVINLIILISVNALVDRLGETSLF